MNALLCHAMYDMASIEHDLHGRAWLAMQDNFIEDETAYGEAAKAVKSVAYALADARHDGDEELAMRDLYELAARLTTEFRYDKLMTVYNRLAMVPA